MLRLQLWSPWHQRARQKANDSPCCAASREVEEQTAGKLCQRQAVRTAGLNLDKGLSSRQSRGTCKTNMLPRSTQKARIRKAHGPATESATAWANLATSETQICVLSVALTQHVSAYLSLRTPPHNGPQPRTDHISNIQWLRSW